MITIYELMPMVKHEKNISEIESVLDRECFNTSVFTQKTYDEIKQSAKDIGKMDELKIYRYLLNQFNMKP